MGSSGNIRRGDILTAHRGKAISLFLVLLTCLVYWQVAQFDFVNYDDSDYVTRNPVVMAGLTVDGLAWAFTTFQNSNWHPLTWLSHMLDVQLFGLDASAHHLVNLLFHVANTLLLFHLLRSMTGAVWRSALVAALFALHPLHVESVAWIAERKDVLSTFFWLIATLFYCRYVRNPSLTRHLPILVFMALGLMSKPMLVTLPFALLLLDYWPLNRPETSALKSGFTYQAIRATWPLIREKLPLFLLTGISCVVTYYAQKHGGAMTSMEHLDTLTRLGNAVLAYATYLVMTIFPVDLAVFYPYPYPDPLPALKVGLSLAALAGVTIAVIKFRNRFPYLPAGWFWYAGTLVPVIGIVQVGGQAMADRYTYIPLIGIFVIVAWGAGDFLKSFPKLRIPVVTCAAIAMAVMMALTSAQVGHWRNGVSLFEHALAVTDDNPVARNNLGQALALKGDYEGATRQFRMALRFDRAQEIVAANLGNALLQLGRTNEAVKYYLVALKLRPYSEKVHNSLGLTYEQLGESDKAIHHYETALRLKPDFSEARTNLGNLHFSAGEFDKAIAHYRMVLQSNPSSAQILNNLGLAFDKTGSRDWAIKHYQQAIAVDPGFAPAHGNLGVAYVRAGRVDEAIDHLQKAVDLDPNYEVARENLEKVLQLRKEKTR